MPEDIAFYNMPMYFEGRKTVPVQPSAETLTRTAKSLSITTPTSTGSSRNSISSKSSTSASSYTSKGSNMSPSTTESQKLPSIITLSEARDTATTLDFTPISTQDVMIYTYGYRSSTDPLSIPGGFETISWDTDKIDETVTAQFLKDRIPSQQGKERLDIPLGFGDGLTDETYSEWVTQKAKRFFLLLLEFGIPEKIFDVVDQSWDDDDLPLELYNIQKLKLRDYHDKALEAKFHKRQFSYILKEFTYRGHIEFDDLDEVPLTVAYRQKTPGFSFAADDRVHRPRNREFFMYRRRVNLGSPPESITEQDFLQEVEILKDLVHPHIIDFQASYIYLSEGCILSSPACDMTLKAFLQTQSGSFKALSKEQRKNKLVGWIHCLSDALAYLHEQGIHRLDIRPRTILINGDHIYLSDISIMTGLDPCLNLDGAESERYEYAAPEHHPKISNDIPVVSATPTSSIRGRSLLKSFSMMSSSSPVLVQEESRFESSENTNSNDNFYKLALPEPKLSGHVGESGSKIASPSKASTFSLGCIFLDLLTLNAKKKPSAFLSHRSSKKGSSRSSGKPDSSLHANPGPVASWIDLLTNENCKRSGGEDRTIKESLQICQSMLHQDPEARPTQRDVTDMLWNIVQEQGGVPHCGTDPSVARQENSRQSTFASREGIEWDWPWEDRRASHGRV